MPLGARPGDPLADIVFALAFAVFQKRVDALLNDLDAMPTIRATGCKIFQYRDQEREDKAGTPSYMDDLALVLKAHTPRQALEKSAKAVVGLKPR